MARHAVDDEPPSSPEQGPSRPDREPSLLLGTAEPENLEIRP